MADNQQTEKQTEVEVKEEMAAEIVAETEVNTEIDTEEFSAEEKKELKKEKIKKIIVSTIVLIVVIAATAFAIYKINESKKNKKGGFGGPGGWGEFGGFGGGGTVTSVQTVVATPETMHDFVNTNGDIETQRSVDVFPSVTSGKVVQVNVSLGSKVRAGDIIAYVDPSAAGMDYKWSPVTAPISGSIIQTPVKVGQQVGSGTIITKIGDVDNLQITVSIPERYVGALKPGLKAEVSLQAYPDVVFSATSVKVSPVLDATNRTKTVILNFDKKDSRVNAGMFAKVKLYTYDYPNSIAIPQDAIVTVKTDSYLYVVKEDSTVEKRLVTLGPNVNGSYQITSGINADERVVVAGMLTLTDGAKVKDISNPAAIADEPKAEMPKTPEGDFKWGDGKPGEMPKDAPKGNAPDGQSDKKADKKAAKKN